MRQKTPECFVFSIPESGLTFQSFSVLVLVQSGPDNHRIIRHGRPELGYGLRSPQQKKTVKLFISVFIHGFAPYMFVISCSAKPDRTNGSRSLRAGFVLCQTLRGAETSAANDIPHLVCFIFFSSVLYPAYPSCPVHKPFDP